MRLDKLIVAILAWLVLLDLFLASWGFFAPDLWFDFFHDSPYVDPQGLLYRSAANWVGFLVLQALAVWRWRRWPGWLLIVVGCRLCDVATDVTCLIFCDRISVMGAILFPVAGTFNLIIGVVLVHLYLRWQASEPNSTS